MSRFFDPGFVRWLEEKARKDAEVYLEEPTLEKREELLDTVLCLESAAVPKRQQR